MNVSLRNRSMSWFLGRLCMGEGTSEMYTLPYTAYVLPSILTINSRPPWPVPADWKPQARMRMQEASSSKTKNSLFILI